jgi:hypothetical protein
MVLTHILFISLGDRLPFRFWSFVPGLWNITIHQFVKKKNVLKVLMCKVWTQFFFHKFSRNFDFSPPDTILTSVLYINLSFLSHRSAVLETVIVSTVTFPTWAYIILGCLNGVVFNTNVTTDLHLWDECVNSSSAHIVPVCSKLLLPSLLTITWLFCRPRSVEIPTYWEAVAPPPLAQSNVNIALSCRQEVTLCMFPYICRKKWVKWITGSYLRLHDRTF